MRHVQSDATRRLRSYARKPGVMFDNYCIIALEVSSQNSTSSVTKELRTARDIAFLKEG